MTTYLFIGLILLLAVYLVRQRRARAAGDGSPRPAKQRVPLRPPRKGAPAANAARTETAATTPPAAREPLPAPSREPLTAPRPAPLAEPALSWTPEETIVEPGWPLPGEIAGGWAAAPAPAAATPFPDGAAAPVAVLEWERPAAATADAADDAAPADDLPSAEEWAMPPFDSAAPLDTPAGPPLWLPGESDVEIPPSSADEPGQPLWAEATTSGAVAGDESAAAVSSPGAPTEFAWGPATEVAEPTPAPEAPAAGLVWADETPAAELTPAPVWVPVAPVADEPVAEEPVAEVPALEEPRVEEPVAEEPAPDAWELPSPVEDAIASFAPIAVTLLDIPAAGDDAPLVSSFGTLTPAPVWPPQSVADAAVAEEPWAPAPVAHAPSPAAPPAIPFTRICDRLGVTPRMLVLMRMLAQTPRSVTEQARELGVSRPLIADLCSRLENAGLASREPVPTDRRRILVTLTDAGRKLCEETADTPI